MVAYVVEQVDTVWLIAARATEVDGLDEPLCWQARTASLDDDARGAQSARL